MTDNFWYYGLDGISCWWCGTTNPYGSLHHKQTVANGGAIANDLFWGYDQVGNAISRWIWKTESSTWDGTQFGYDHLDRLTSANPFSGYAGDSDNISYSPDGNITSKAGVGSYDYYNWGSCTGYRPHAVRSINSGALGFCYDANGNAYWRWEGGHLYLQSWDADNKLIGVQEKSTVDWSTNIGAPTTETRRDPI